MTIGLYLGAMGLGAFTVPKSQRETAALSRLFRVALLLSLVGAFAPAIIHFAHGATTFVSLHSGTTNGIFIFFPTAILVIVLIGFLSGIELPLLMQLAEDERVNRVLAADFVGSLLGAVLFPTLLLLQLDDLLIAFAIASANVGAMVVLHQYLTRLEARDTFVRAGLIFGSGACLLIAVVCHARVEQYFLRRYYYYKEYPNTWSGFLSGMSGLPTVERYVTPYQRIDIVHLVSGDYSDFFIDPYSSKFRDDPAFPWRYGLFLNGELQAFSNFEEIYHEYLAHVPLIRSGSVPRRILVLGGGDGMLLRELLKYPAVEGVTLVDIDPQMIALARNHPVLVAMNKRSFDDPRVTVITDDAYRYIQHAQERFDAIYLDFPHPTDFSVSRLYSREFYSMVRSRLAPGGYAAMNADGINYLSAADSFGRQEIHPDNKWPLYYATLTAAGFEHVRPFFSNREPDNPRA
ncbi:MAG: methyltransferase domain-containing protein, partial [Bdellovibrionales bacterium]|nr:methyltransferase domain-containing protein [Bdellovibrionales bacterium]